MEQDHEAKVPELVAVWDEWRETRKAEWESEPLVGKVAAVHLPQDRKDNVFVQNADIKFNTPLDNPASRQYVQNAVQ